MNDNDNDLRPNELLDEVWNQDNDLRPNELLDSVWLEFPAGHEHEND